MTFDTLTAALNTGGDHIGDLVWWTLAEARIERPTLERIWATTQLAPDYLPDPPTAEKALKLAVREAQLGLTDTLIRLGLEDDARVIFSVVAESKHPDGTLSHTQEARVLLERSTGTLTTDVHGHEVVAVIQAAFRKYRHTHTSDDVRRAMLRVLDGCAAVTLRESGGVYWVPAPHMDDVRRLQRAIEQIGESKVHLLPVHRSAEAEKTLGSVARESIEGELAQLQQELQEFLSTPPARTSTLLHRLEAYEALNQRAQLYRSVLSVRVDDLDSQLDQLTASVHGLLELRGAA